MYWNDEILKDRIAIRVSGMDESQNMLAGATIAGTLRSRARIGLLSDPLAHFQ